MDLRKLHVGDRIRLKEPSGDLEGGRVVSVDEYTGNIGILFDSDIAPTYFDFGYRNIVPIDITKETLSSIGFTYDENSEMLCDAKMYKFVSMDGVMFAYVRDEGNGKFRLFMHDYARREECSMIVTSIHEIQQAFRLIEKIHNL